MITGPWRSVGLGALAITSAFPLLAAGGGDTGQPPAVVSSTRVAIGRSAGPWRTDPEEIFKLQCVPCHGARGRGDGPAAVAFNPRPADLTDAEIMNARTDADLRAVLESGKGSMPAFGPVLAADDLDSLVVYIRTLRGG